MQQTEKYQLNLIETSDTFSPAALNENAQKTEAALAAARAEAAAATAAGDAAEASARAAGDAALEQRIIALEGKHAVGGTYVGTGGTQVIQLEFTPVVVFIYYDRTRFAMIHRGITASNHKIVEGGFSVGTAASGTENFNGSGITYSFIAIG